MGSWEKLCKTMLESNNFGGAIAGNGFLKKTVEEVLNGESDPRAKIEKIHSYVKNTLEWDGTKDMYDDNIKKVVEAKKGTAADLNILMASMLEKAGIPVDMVLLSTRDHGFVRRPFPMERQLNYVICRAKAGTEYLYLDATEKYLPMNVLPQRCLNGEGLLVSKINTGWVNLDAKGRARTVIDAVLTLSNDGSMDGKLQYALHGYDGSNSRKAFFKEGEENYFKTASPNTWEIKSKAFENSTDITKPAIKKLEVTIPSHASIAGDQIYINPFVTQQLTENPFRSPSREYPVDFGNPVETIYMGKITIPDGYTAEELPQSKIYSLPDNGGKYVYNMSVVGRQISIVSTLQINKSMFVQTEYDILRRFYDLIVAKQSEQIVLKKI
jgi:hypothetical protein